MATLRVICLSWCVLVTAAEASSNSPEAAQRNAEAEVLPKVKLACGVDFTLTYDDVSLKANNRDIGYDQTGGSNECNESLRYLWYACQSEPGKAAVRRSEVRQLVCKGVTGTTGALRLQGTTLTIERAFEEPKPFLRSRKQFEAAFKLKLKLENEDPYSDSTWDTLRRAPNPVTSTSTYCLVDGKKVALDENLVDDAERRRRDTTIRCLDDGLLINDVTVKAGLKTGLVVQRRDAWRRNALFLDGKQHGLEETFEGKRALGSAMYERGERVWSKELHPDGSLARYWRQYPDGQASLTLDDKGQVQGLSCLPATRGDLVLDAWCGFQGARTVQVFDGTGALNVTLTLKAGQVVKQEAGSSAYSARSTVAFVDGKKDGLERVQRKDGTLASTTAWKKGTQDGKALTYAEDGQKVVQEELWREGELQRRTRFFLNGQPKLLETYATPDTLERLTFFDLGAKQSEGHLIRCRAYEWCEEGLQREWFENGRPRAEVRFAEGALEGLSTHWSAEGIRSDERFAHGVRLSLKETAADGRVLRDEAYEADGSRKR
jgi:hypothetical protein